MSRASLSLSICLSLGLGLTACGDDSNPGGGGETDTDAGSTTDAPTTDEPTTDEPTTGEPTTDPGTTTTGDPTTDPDSSSGDPADTDTEGETTAVVVPEDRYFQVNSLQVRDPHLFLNLVVDMDITDTVNDQLTTALTTDDPEDPDGFLDLGFVLAFLPLDQADGGSEPMFFTNAQCTAPAETSTCDVLGDSVPSDSTYASAEVECYAPDEANLSMYDTTPDAPEATPGPCFSAPFDAVGILAGDFILPMTDVTVSASYVGNLATNLVSGNIEGFISSADADATVVPTPVGDRFLSELLREEDMDGDGWVFHIAFTAVETEWTGE